MGAWLLPSLEPYRTSRIVGERLAVLSRTLRAQPVLLTFQEPSVIYAMGHPVPTIQDMASSSTSSSGSHGAVITPLLPHELAEFHRRPWLEVEVQETLTGFNLNKGQTQTLRFTLVRERRSNASRRPQQLLVERAELLGHRLVAELIGEPAPALPAHRVPRAPGRPPAGGSRR